MKYLVIICYSLSLSAWAATKQKSVDCSKEKFYKQVRAEALKLISKVQKDKVVAFSRELIKQETDLNLREIQLRKEREQLVNLEKELGRRIKQFDQSQQKIISCLDKRNERSQKRVSHMVSVISNMRPKNAAQLLSVQDPDLSVKIISSLPPQKVAKIFNAMDKEVSARLQKQYMTMQK
jgi:flagellar motility protein MotE (MotC chaperone)